MRKLLIASILLASIRVASAQPTPPAGGDPATEPKAEPPTEPPAEVKPPPEEKQPEEGGGATAPVEEEPKKDEPPAVTAKYDSGLKLQSADGQYSLKLSFRNQVRFESLRPFEDNSQFLNKFYMPRSRFQAEGHAFGENNRFKVELGMGDQGSFSFLKDVFLEKKVAAEGPLWIRAGQWKRPFSRLEMVSDFASEFNERSIANELAGGGRDQGVAVHNDYEKTAEGIEWVVGMFNRFNGGNDRPVIAAVCTTNPMTGAVMCINSRPATFPADFAPALVARAGWNSAKAKGYSEADLEGGALRYSVAAAYKIDLGNFAKQGQPSVADNLSHGLEVDWNVKANGLSLSGMLVMMKLKAADAEYGFVLQPGMFLVPKHVQVAARFGLVTAGDRKQVEALGAFNYYWHGHKMKIATDFGILKLTGEDPVTMTTDKPDIRIRLMGQLDI